jgi:hypothetical protein
VEPVRAPPTRPNAYYRRPSRLGRSVLVAVFQFGTPFDITISPGALDLDGDQASAATENNARIVQFALKLRF